MSTLDQLRTEFETLNARASAAEARATAAEEELKRYQLADVGGRVRIIEQWHDAVASSNGNNLAAQHRGELLDIVRRQQAEIEHLKLRAKLDAEYIETLKKDLAWERDCVVVELKERLREYEGVRQRIESLPGSDACGHAMEGTPVMLVRDAVLAAIDNEDKTEPQPKVEPELLGKIEQLPEAPTEEAYRPGLPPEALRKAWPEWEDSQGDRLRFTEDGERFGFLTLSGAAIESESTYIAEDRNGGQFAVCKHRPYGATRSEVEQKAARMLGEQDAKAGRDRMGETAIETAIGARHQLALDAYHAGYDGAIEYRAFPTPSQITAANKQGLRWEAASTKCEPLATFSHDAEGYLLAHQDDSPRRVTGVSARLWVNDQWRPVTPDRRPVPWSRVGG